MTPQEVRRELAALADPQYRAFTQKLVPGALVAYGVRTPALRAMARKILKAEPLLWRKEAGAPQSYEETLLRAFVLGGVKLPLEEKLPLVTEFLPLLDNWAVCDGFCSSFRPKELELPALWA